MEKLWRYTLFVFIVSYANGQYEGDRCVKDSRVGVCRLIDVCRSAQVDIQHRRQPQLCSFSITTPIVCCLDDATDKPPVATTPKIVTTSTTQYVPIVYDYKELTEVAADGCEPLSANETAAKTGQKAWDKCIDYQLKLVFPCTESMALTGDLERARRCHHTTDGLIVGGVETSTGEFPHMALLGYGPDEGSAEWLCGGSIISERFILTAGHCTSSTRLGSVTYAKVGIQTRTEQVDSSKVYRIQNIIKHPGYDSPNRYNDIALLETARDIKLNEFVVPACLDVRAPGKYSRALASGWGATKNRGSNADELQKVVLEEFSTTECSGMFPVHRLMKQGFDPDTQICYGDRHMSKDTCQGDSGGPLQIYSRQIYCMYTLIGITSFGKACGNIGQPGIYTRVAHYVPWIEKIVWP